LRRLLCLLIPDGVDPVLYLVGRFGCVLDEDAADKARGFVYAKLRARLEKIAAKEPELAAALAELAERMLWSLGGLLASPEAARRAHDVLFYLFEGYYTKDGVRLYERIEGAVEEAVRRAEEAGVIDAEYRVKQWVLTVLDILATAGERYRRDGLKAISTVEKALRTTAFAGLSASALYSLYQGLYSEAVVSAVASAVALAEAGRFREAVERVRRAAEALYEEARELFEKVKVTLQRLVELLVEAVARALAWADAHKAYLFLMAAVAAGLVALQYALEAWGLVELGRLSYAVLGVGPYGSATAERLREALEKRWQVDAVAGEVEGPFRKALAKMVNAYEEVEKARRKIEGVRKGAPFVITREELAAVRRAWREMAEAAEEFRKAAAEIVNTRPELRKALEIDEAKARELAAATADELPRFSGLNAGTKAYAALLSLAEGGMYGHIASVLLREGRLKDLLRQPPTTAYNTARELAGAAGESLHPSRMEKPKPETKALLLFFAGLDEGHFKKLSDVEVFIQKGESTYVVIRRAGEEAPSSPLAELVVAKGGAALLVGGLLFEELKRAYEGGLRGGVEVPPAGRLSSALGWLATDVTIEGNYVMAGTAQRWQAAALHMLLGKPDKIEISFFTVTMEGLKPAFVMKWRREVLDNLVKEAEWVKHIPDVENSGVKSFDDLIRLSWNDVVDIVKKAGDVLKQHITCRGGGQCGEEKIGEMLKTLEAFAEKAKKWARGGLGGEEAERFYREARKYLAPALLLLELKNAKTQKEREAPRGGAKPEETLWRFGLAFAAAVAGDGAVRRGGVRLYSGDGGAALLWLAVLQKAGELAGFKPRLYVKDKYYHLEVSGQENAAALAALMPAVGLNPKAEEAVDMFREWAEREVR